MSQILVSFFRAVFLRHQPRRFAVMQPESADRKYNDHPGQLSDSQIKAHLEGRAAYAVPYAANGLASLLALDIDVGGIEVATALLKIAAQRGLFAFGQLDTARQRGYVYIPFDDLTNAARLHQLGAQLIAAVHQPGWKIENRATEEDTRLPFARHVWTGQRGQLLHQTGEAENLDTDFNSILERFIANYRENPTNTLPAAPEPTQKATSSPRSRETGTGYTIQHYNQETDLIGLLESYGARSARGKGARLYFCPFHSDDHASLIVSKDGQKCRCLSQGSDCPLSKHQNDAFNVFCLGENLTTGQALRRLNGLPDDPAPKQTVNTPRKSEVDKSNTSQTLEPFYAPSPLKTVLSTTAEDGRRLPKTCRRILAIFKAEGGQYWRGIPQLARLLDCDPRTVQRSIRRLETENLIETISRGKSGHTDIYKIVEAKGRQMPPTIEINNINTEILEAERGGDLAAQIDQQPDEDGAYHYGDAIAYPNGAAYIPPGAEVWYNSLTPTKQTEQQTTVQVDQAESQPAPERHELLPSLPLICTARRRRQTKRTERADPNKLQSRIIAATKKAEKLEQTGKAKEKAQARAIRRNVEHLRRQQEQATAHYYTLEECDRWQVERDQPQQPDDQHPPFQFNARELIDHLKARCNKEVSLFTTNTVLIN